MADRIAQEVVRRVLEPSPEPVFHADFYGDRHGKSAIGAVRLDKSAPSKVLGRSIEPPVRPETTERESHVPDVVYTCGALLRGDRIVLPYAVSDSLSNFAAMKIAALLQPLKG